MRAGISTRGRSVLGAFFVLGSDRPFVPAISAAPSQCDGLSVDRRLRPHESSDTALGASVRKPKAQIHEREDRSEAHITLKWARPTVGLQGVAQLLPPFGQVGGGNEALRIRIAVGRDKGQHMRSGWIDLALHVEPGRKSRVVSQSD